MKKRTKIAVLSLMIFFLCAEASFAGDKAGFIKKKWREFLAVFKKEDTLKKKEEKRIKSERIERELKGGRGDSARLEIPKPPPTPPRIPIPPPSPPQPSRR